MTTAGDLDRQITFQQVIETQDATGDVVRTWENLASNATVWASVQPLKGSELMMAGGIFSVQDKAFIVRYRTDIVAKMRIVFDGNNYDIHDSAEADPAIYGRKMFTRILAKAVT